MLLADYHIHSTCSPDAEDSMALMAKAAFDRGVSQLCFTDHADFDIPATMQPDRSGPLMPARQRAAYDLALSQAPKGLDVRIGLELGEANHDPERGLAVYAMPEYDFILGSLHNLRATEDFYYISYRSPEQCRELYSRYMDELLELSAVGCFDCMAHIGYFIRYSHKCGLDVGLTLEDDGDKLELLLRGLIQSGRGIELNCGDLVPGGRSDPLLMPIPNQEVLRLYRRLGGEIITLGSDGHCAKAAGLGIAQGQELLRSLGYKYFCTYKKHIPEFIKL